MRRGMMIIIAVTIFLFARKTFSAQKDLIKISTDKTNYIEGETIKLKIESSKKLMKQRKIRRIEIRYPWGEKEWKRIEEEIEIEKEARESKGDIEVGIKRTIAKLIIPL